jgi:hypothetical protein
MAVGFAGLVGAWLVAPRAASGDDPLVTTGLAEPGQVARDAVSTPSGVGGSPFTAIALAMIGPVLLGAGWSGVHASWLDNSLLARLAPQRVTVVGTLHTDPEAGAFGWHATLDVTRVEWPGAAASLRASLWLSADDDPPPWVRGDVVTAGGVIRRPDDPGFLDALEHKGMVVELNAIFERIFGPLSRRSCVRPVFQAFVDRSPGSSQQEAGCCSGWPWATRGWTRHDARLQASGLGHLLVVQQTSRWCWRRSSGWRRCSGSQWRGSVWPSERSSSSS